MPRLGRTGRRRDNSNRCNHKQIQPEDETYIQLLKWMKKNGFRNKHLKPFNFPDTGRGLMTTKCLRQEDLAIQLPKHLMITSTTVIDSCIGPFIKRLSKKLSPMQVLCLYLITERHRKEQSFWYPYIQTLPRTFSTPAFFSREEIDFLPGRLKLSAFSQIQEVRNAYIGIKSCAKDIKASFEASEAIFTYDAFRWAWFVVNTRSVYMLQPKHQCLSSEEDHYALAPFLDLLNHTCAAQVEAGLNGSTRCYEIKTFSPYKKYEQVFINYGPHDNATLFLEYGFTLPVNDHNVVSFEFDDLRKICSDIGLDDMKRKFQFLQDNNLSRDLSCSLIGLSWNLKTSVSILGEVSHDRNVWKTFVSGTGQSSENKVMKEIVRRLVALAKASLPDTGLINKLNCTDHQGLALSLTMDIIGILEAVDKSWMLDSL